MSLPNKTIWSASVIKSQRKEAVPLFTKLYQEDSLQKSQRTGQVIRSSQTTQMVGLNIFRNY